MGVGDSIRQTFGELVVHTPHVTTRMQLPFTFSTFDYRDLCAALFEQTDAEFETAKVEGNGTPPCPDAKRRTGRALSLAPTAATSRPRSSSTRWAGSACWRRTAADTSRPTRRCRAGSRFIPAAGPATSRSGSTAPTSPPGTRGASRPRDEVRVGVGSFDPRFHVKEPTVRLAEDLERDAVRYQGNWIPHRLRPAAVDTVFFAGDSAGHCLPLTAEGIRTAFYFGIACGAELRRVIEGHATRDEALRRYAHFSATHRWKFEAMLRTQRLVPACPRACSRSRCAG